jgi:hypothetical protein
MELSLAFRQIRARRIRRVLVGVPLTAMLAVAAFSWSGSDYTEAAGLAAILSATMGLALAVTVTDDDPERSAPEAVAGTSEASAELERQEELLWASTAMVVGMGLLAASRMWMPTTNDLLPFTFANIELGAVVGLLLEGIELSRRQRFAFALMTGGGAGLGTIANVLGSRLLGRPGLGPATWGCLFLVAGLLLCAAPSTAYPLDQDA